MKKTLLCLIVAGATFSSTAQLKIDNATFFISPGATVTVQGDVTSNVDIQGTGLLLLKGTTLQNVDMAGFTIPNLEIDNLNNINFTGNAKVGSSILFTNGKALLNAFDLRLESAVTSVAGASNQKFVITNGTGRLLRRALGATAFNFPVGFSATEFNPLTIANTGTVDTIGVRCLQNVLDQGLTGSPVIGDFANNSWVVTEATAGGSNLALTAEWAAADQLPNFNTNKVGVARWNTGTDWDLPASNVIAAAGSGPFNRTRSNILSTGVFAVADLDKVNSAGLNLKIFLQGAYSGTTMTDGLRSLNLVPVTQPYNAAMNVFFTRVGVYDGSASVNETVPSTTVFDVAGTNDDIVDWVYLSLQDGTTPATKLQTRAALVQRDGDIVQYDPVSTTYVPVRMPIDADANYHLVVGHRNHLAIRTPLSQLLQDNVTFTYNFTDAQNKAFQNGAITTNAAMKDLTPTVFGLWAGNANSNTASRASGGNATLNDFLYLVNTVLGGNNAVILSNVYNNADMNMNGTARASGGSSTLNDFLYLVNIVLGGNNALIFTAHQ